MAKLGTKLAARMGVTGFIPRAQKGQIRMIRRRSISKRGAQNTDSDAVDHYHDFAFTLMANPKPQEQLKSVNFSLPNNVNVGHTGVTFFPADRL